MSFDRLSTMQEIADQAGVSRMTVSLALRNSPKISAATAGRIRSVAERLGYRPNPLVSALMTQLRDQKAIRKPSTIAYVTAYPTASGWREPGPFVEFFKGARKRAETLGYTLEEWWLRQPNLTEDRFSEILYTRNIHGLMIAPLPAGGGELHLKWQNFAVSTIAYSVTAPEIHRASNDQYGTITLALRELSKLGYRRIGLAITEEQDLRVKRKWSAGMLVYQQGIPVSQRVPLLLTRTPFPREFAAWFRKHQPEAVVSLANECVSLMSDLGSRVPEHAGFAQLALTNDDRKTAGVNQNSELVGAASIDLIDAQLRRNERGLPPFPKSLLIQGYWVPGPTVRPVDSPAVPRRDKRARVLNRVRR